MLYDDKYKLRLFKGKATRLSVEKVVLKTLKRMLKMHDFQCVNNCWIILNNFFLREAKIFASALAVGTCAGFRKLISEIQKSSSQSLLLGV